MTSKPTFVRSPLFYVGDKYKLLPQIINKFPKNIETFFEPFAGGASVGLNSAAHKYVFNDIDRNIVSIHKMLLKYAPDQKLFFNDIDKIIKKYGLSRSYNEDIVPIEMRQQYKKTYYAHFNKKGYEELRSAYNSKKQHSAIVLYLLLIYGFNRMVRFNSSGQFNVPVGNVDFNSNVYQSLLAYFTWAGASSIEWDNSDCIEFLNKIDVKENDFIYLDPPYLISFSEYNKIWDSQNEVALLDKIDELSDRGARFAISNVTHYKGATNTIFLDWSKKYNKHDVESNYISYHDNSKKKINEVLITNYE